MSKLKWWMNHEGFSKREAAAWLRKIEIGIPHAVGLGRKSRPFTPADTRAVPF